MSSVFPSSILDLPEADVPLKGARAHLSQGSDHQVVFMEFEADAVVPPHSHGAQWGVVVAGSIELVIGGRRHAFARGDSYFIPEGVEHSARVSEGYAEVAFFADRDRYRARE